MTSSAVKWAKRVAIGVLMAGLVLAMCAVLLLKTGWLFNKIEHQVQLSTGYELKLPDRASLSSVYPRVGINVPAAVIRSTDAESPLQRLRLDDISVSLPLNHVRNNPLNEMTIKARSVTAIYEGGTESGNNTAGDLPISLPVLDVESLLAQMLSGVTDTNLSVAVDELQVIARNSSGLSSIYTTRGIQLVLTPENLQLSGTYDVAETGQNFLLQHHLLEAEAGIATRISLNITSDEEAPRAYSVTSQQTIRGEQIDIEEFVATGPDLNLSGQLSVALEQRYRLSGSLNIRQLELADLPGISANAAPTDTDTIVLFSDDVVDPGQYADIDLSLSLGAIRLNNQPVISGDVLVRGTREQFSVQSDRVSLLGGRGEFTVSADASDEGQRVSVRADIKRAQLSRLQVTQDEKLLFSSGDADLKISMRSTGNTQKELARSLAGYIMFASSDIELSQRYAEALDRGIVSFVLKSIDKLRNADDSAAPDHRDGSLPLSCASLKLVVNEGRVEVINGLIVDLPDNVLISSGFVDLHAETLGFAFRTKKKRLFDWSALSLVKFVELGGRLAEPRLSLDRKALLKQGLLTSSSVIVGALPPLVYRLADAGLKSGQQVECTPKLY